ncbi:MAG TPA: tetratricopeptide repeat protein, partial [Bacteroidales bacterium]|nr:tetratricopeptide repeat protein [Bacteroidales bacterium]
MNTLPDDRFQLAFDKILEGNLQDAAGILEEEHVKNPGNIAVLLELGNIYYILCEMSKSIEYYKKILEIKPLS